MKKGSNLQTIKSSNRAAILYLLNEKGNLSRKQIASMLGLTAAAVTKITANLLEEDVICEKEAIGSGVGRKEVLLSLKFGDFKAFGVTFERDYITFSVSSLDGNLDEKESISFSNDFSYVRNEIYSYYQKIKNKYHFLGAGISIIGFDNKYGIWPNINLQGELEEIIDIPVIIRNNVQAFSTATVLYEHYDEKNILVFKWGPGIGSSFIRNGKVLSGDDQGVAEIGHMIVVPNGKLCRCGRVGCLETETALDRIKEEVQLLSIDEIFNSKDQNIIDVLDKKISMVCLALLNASTVLDANKIILFGSVFQNQSFLERFHKKWNEITINLSNKTIEVSNINEKASYIGSTAMVARKLFFEKGM